MQAVKGKDINKAVQLLKQGNIIAIPTETVYGLACNALDEKAVEELYRIKERSLIKAIPVQLSSAEEVIKYVLNIPDPVQQLMNRFWPGPLTILLPKNNVLPDILTAGSINIAIRVPYHPMTIDLLKKINFPLAVTSANISGKESLKNADDVINELQNKIAYVLDGGKSKIGKESTILGYEGKKIVIYRIGAISINQLKQILPKTEISFN